MTLREAMHADIKAVRKPYWNPTARLELPARVGDGWGPWCKLHDGDSVSDITIFEVEDHANDWEQAA